MNRLIRFFLAILAVPALAQDPAPKDFNLFEYLRAHAYVTTGALNADGEKHAIVELRIVDDFKISNTVRGVYRASLFSMARSGEQLPPPVIPTSIEQARKAYSDGEIWIGAYRPFSAFVAAECIAGLTFKMASITGSKGDPLDGTKSAFGCGPRFSYAGNHITVAGGHYGAVAENGKLLGFVPNALVVAYVPLKFLGKNTALTPDFAIGATKPAPGDKDQRRTLSKSLRVLISARF